MGQHCHVGTASLPTLNTYLLLLSSSFHEFVMSILALLTHENEQSIRHLFMIMERNWRISELICNLLVTTLAQMVIVVQANHKKVVGLPYDAL